MGWTPNPVFAEEELSEVEKFCYLSNNVSTVGAVSHKGSICIQNARLGFIYHPGARMA